MSNSVGAGAEPQVAAEGAEVEADVEYEDDEDEDLQDNGHSKRR